MSDVPLTEKRFLELFSSQFKVEFDKNIEPIRNDIKEMKEDISVLKTDVAVLKTDVAVLKTDVSVLKKDMIEVKGFIKHESNAIEYELHQYLRDYLKKKYPLKVLEPIKTKHIYNPLTGKEITEFDACFILKQINRKADYSRLKAASLPVPSKEQIVDQPYIFVLAEAKHYISTEKVKQKLKQFDEICEVFELAKNPIQPISSKFERMIKYNTIFKNIGESILVFGAAYWEEQLLTDLEAALEQREKYVKNFLVESGNKKLELYKKICLIENEWYLANEQPNKLDLSDEQILLLTEIKGAMSNVKIVKPSGGRFVVGDINEITGVSHYSLNGGKTKKNKK